MLTWTGKRNFCGRKPPKLKLKNRKYILTYIDPFFLHKIGLGLASFCPRLLTHCSKNPFNSTGGNNTRHYFAGVRSTMPGTSYYLRHKQNMRIKNMKNSIPILKLLFLQLKENITWELFNTNQHFEFHL